MTSLSIESSARLRAITASAGLVKMPVKVTAVRYPSDDEDNRKRADGDKKVWYIFEAAMVFAEGVDGGMMTAKGEMFFRPTVGERLQLHGKWTVYNGRREFSVVAAELDLPVDDRAMLNYVCELTPGFGPATTEAIWELHGANWRRLDAGDIRGVTARKVAAFRETLEDIELKKEQHTTIAWLMDIGASRNLAAAAWEKWLVATRGTVLADCYRLTELPGYGFLTVDKTIRCKLGVADNDPRRVDAAVQYAVNVTADAGDTAATWTALSVLLRQYLPSVDMRLIADRTKDMMQSGNKLIGFPARQMIAGYKHYTDEQAIFDYCCQPEPEPVKEVF